MDISDIMWMLLVFYICWNRRHRSRTVQGDPGDDIFEAVRLQILHKLSHAAAFQLKDPFRIAFRDNFIYLRIIVFHPGKIDFDSVILFDHRKRISYDRQVSQPQKVHFQQSQFFDRRHIELSGQPFIRKIQRHVFIDTVPGYHHAGCMR